jgi:hypothetical protein
MGKVKSALGWPLRRALNPRMEATIQAVDFRLGSSGDARPSVHHRLDELEGKLDRLADDLGRLRDTMRREAALERRVTGEALSTVVASARNSGRDGAAASGCGSPAGHFATSRWGSHRAPRAAMSISSWPGTCALSLGAWRTRCRRPPSRTRRSSVSGT